MTFYFVELIHKQSNKSFFKFGETSSNIQSRFNVVWDKRYADFEIREVYTIAARDKLVHILEKFFLTMYPKNMYLEDYLGVSKGSYDGLSGITEIVRLSDSQVDDIREIMQLIAKECRINPEQNDTGCFVTSSGYLSIAESSLKNKTVLVEGKSYSVSALLANQHYNDNVDAGGNKIYRWSYYNYANCAID